MSKAESVVTCRVAGGMRRSRATEVVMCLEEPLLCVLLEALICLLSELHQGLVVVGTIQVILHDKVHLERGSVKW